MALSLQTVVLAVIVGAFLFADWPLRNDRLPKRLFQIGLALGISLLVGSFTDTFIMAGDESRNTLNIVEVSDSDNEGFIERAIVADAVQFAAGAFALMLGVAGLARRPTVALATVLAGVILVIGTAGGLQLNLLYTEAFSERSTADEPPDDETAWSQRP